MTHIPTTEGLSWDNPKRLPPTASTQLPNRKHELFCRFVADGSTYSDAYANAGYSPSTSNASVLANRPEIKARIEALREEKAKMELEFQVRLREAGVDPDAPEKVEEVKAWTIERVLNMVETNVRLAQSAGEYKAAKESLELLANIMGLLEAAKSGNNRGNSTPAQVSLTFVDKVLSGTEDGSGGELEDRSNPLAPKLPKTRNTKSVAKS